MYKICFLQRDASHDYNLTLFNNGFSFILQKFVDTASKTFNEVKNTAEGYLKDFQSTAKPDAEKKN